MMHTIMRRTKAAFAHTSNDSETKQSECLKNIIVMYIFDLDVSCEKHTEKRMTDWESAYTNRHIVDCGSYPQTHLSKL